MKILGFLISENGEIKLINATEENIKTLSSDTALVSSDNMESRVEIAKELLCKTDKQKLITGVLNDMGISANIKGYKYIRSALTKMIGDEIYSENITKMLYPEIAKEFDTTSSRVERSIRHAIESNWNSVMVKYLSELGIHANHVSGKLTNSQFLASITECLKTKYDM